MQDKIKNINSVPNCVVKIRIIFLGMSGYFQRLLVEHPTNQLSTITIARPSKLGRIK